VATNAQMRDTVGNKTDAAYPVTSGTKSIMAYVKGVVSLLYAPAVDLVENVYLRDVVGNKSDAAQTTVIHTRSIMAYVKGILNQIASHITALATHDTALGVVDGNVDAIKALVDDDLFAVVRKNVTLAANPSCTLFTVTGEVIVRVFAVCMVAVGTTAYDVLSVGIGGSTAAIIPETAGNLLVAREIWHDATPDAEIEEASVAKEYIISNGNDILLTAPGICYPGQINFVCFWKPLSTDGAVVAA